MEWLIYPLKLWNLITAFAYIVIPVVFFVVVLAWAYIHRPSFDRFYAAYMKWSESKIKGRY